MNTNQLRLYTFDAGQVITSGVRFVNAAGAEEVREMRDPNHCYLVQHPRGLLMWDTGLPDAIAALKGQTRQRGRFRFRLRKTLAAQLTQTGFDPTQVDYLAFSHLQVDHAGNAGLFPNARVLIQSAEWQMAFGSQAAAWGYVPGDYAMLARQEVTQLDGDFDVFGDGRVVILAAPGHTPGHQVLLVALESGPLLLSGDLYYAEKDPSAGWMPAWNYDRAQAAATMQRLAAIAQQHGARWVINHDPQPNPPVALAPIYQI